MAEQERKKLADAPKEKTFRTRLGKEIKNLRELSKTLDETPEDNFSEHVNDKKNDFANWIKNVLEDNELAEELYKTTDFKRTKQLVSARIKWLEDQIKRYEQHDETSQRLSLMSAEIKGDEKQEKTGSPEESKPAAPEKAKKKDESKKQPQAAVQQRPKAEDEITSAVKQVQQSPSNDNQEKVSDIHPVSHFKSNVHQVILGILIGLILGMVIGFSAATFLVCGR
jgi:hypothetical protein